MFRTFTLQVVLEPSHWAVKVTGYVSLDGAGNFTYPSGLCIGIAMFSPKSRELVGRRRDHTMCKTSPPWHRRLNADGQVGLTGVGEPCPIYIEIISRPPALGRHSAAFSSKQISSADLLRTALSADAVSASMPAVRNALNAVQSVLLHDVRGFSFRCQNRLIGILAPATVSNGKSGTSKE